MDRTQMINDFYNQTDEDFEAFADYQLHICEKREMLGNSGHLLHICKKQAHG